MKITGFKVYQVDLPLAEGNSSWSEGKSVDVFDSTVVQIETDSGVVGYGEVCPLGPVYLPAYAAGARAGMQELAPQLIGEDPTQLWALNHKMDRVMKGHPYVKSAIDMACWDILGKVSGLPVCTLLGGRFGDDVVLYRAISQRPAAEMADNVAGYRAEGYRRFQLKVGGRPDEDIERIRAVREILQPGDKLVADANTGWLMHEAMRVVGAVRDVDVYIEQPCATYQQCLTIQSAVHLGRSHRLGRRDPEGRLRSRDGCRQHQDQQVRRTDQSQTGTRPVCIPGDRDDSRRQLGRGHHHRSDRAPGTQHADGLSVHVHGFQQLRHPIDRQRGTPTGQRPDGSIDRSRAGDHPQVRRPRRPGLELLSVG